MCAQTHIHTRTRSSHNCHFTRSRPLASWLSAAQQRARPQGWASVCSCQVSSSALAELRQPHCQCVCARLNEPLFLKRVCVFVCLYVCIAQGMYLCVCVFFLGSAESNFRVWINRIDAKIKKGSLKCADLKKRKSISLSVSLNRSRLLVVSQWQTLVLLTKIYTDTVTLYRLHMTQDKMFKIDFTWCWTVKGRCAPEDVTEDCQPFHFEKAADNVETPTFDWPVDCIHTISLCCHTKGGNIKYDTAVLEVGSRMNVGNLTNCFHFTDSWLFRNQWTQGWEIGPYFKQHTTYLTAH